MTADCTFCDLPHAVGPYWGIRWFGPNDAMPVCLRCIRDVVADRNPMRHRRVV